MNYLAEAPTSDAIPSKTENDNKHGGIRSKQLEPLPSHIIENQDPPKDKSKQEPLLKSIETPKDELKFVFEINRHGARAPLRDAYD